MDLGDEFKKPVAPNHSPIRPQDFPLYAGGHPYHLLAPGGSAFHRPLDPSGKPIAVSVKQHMFKSEKCIYLYKKKTLNRIRVCRSQTILMRWSSAERQFHELSNTSENQFI